MVFMQLRYDKLLPYENARLLHFLDNKCGGILYSLKGTFTTPNYPSMYPINSNCLWVVKIPFAKGIKLEYDDFALEESSECTADRMITKAPRPFQSTRECGLNAKDKILTEKVAMIEFVSNGLLERRGFKARYDSLFMLEDNPKVKTTMQSTRRQATANPGLFIFTKQKQSLPSSNHQLSLSAVIIPHKHHHLSSSL